jgi:hypothetical protein
MARQDMAELPEELAQALEDPAGARFLQLTDVTELPAAIGRLENLESLSVFAAWMAGGKQQSLAVPPELAALSRLRELTLYFPLDAVPPPLARLPQLEVLNIHFTRPAAGEGLLALPALRDLEVELMSEATAGAPEDEANKLDVPPWLWGLTRLRKLTLRGRFRGLPDELAALADLEELDLTSAGRFADFPPAITRLPRLRALMIYAEAIPAEIARLGELEQLVVKGTELSALPAEIGRLRKLKALDVESPRLTAVPDEIGALGALETLSLCDSRIERLPPAIGRLRALKTLALSSNPLPALPDEIGELASLELLEIGQAPQESLGPRTLPRTIGRLKKLHTIWATCGRLEALPAEIGGCESLRTVYLDDQRIASLPPEIGRLQNLSWLHLKNNPLRALPAELADCAALTELELSGCTFPREAFDVVERIAARPNCTVNRPRVDETRAPIPTAASSARLAPAVLAEIARLGGRVESPPEVPASRFEDTKAGRWPIPEAIRQLTRDVKWPAKTTYGGEIDDAKEWLVQFGIGADLDEYECGFYHPYYTIGQTDGGNYMLLVDLSDPDPTDPAVYRLDHDEFSEHDALRRADHLSTFLAALSPETKGRRR